LQCVFATDYPQGVRDDAEVAAYFDATARSGPRRKACLTAPMWSGSSRMCGERGKARAA
jgi:hypothetical protein